MEMRLLLAFVLMGLVLFITPYIYKPAPAPKGTTTVKPSQVAELTQKPAEAAPATTARPRLPRHHHGRPRDLEDGPRCPKFY